MKKLIITAIIGLIIGLGAIQARPVFHPGPHKAKEIRHDRKQVRTDKRKLHSSVKHGNPARAKHNARKLHRDKRELRHDRKGHR
jgi:hypothetical protein